MRSINSSYEPTSAKGWPRADQGTYRPVTQAMRQVGTDRGHDAHTEAPLHQSWYTLVPPAGVEDHYALSGGPDPMPCR
jgi:hypothetical protein